MKKIWAVLFAAMLLLPHSLVVPQINAMEVPFTPQEFSHLSMRAERSSEAVKGTKVEISEGAEPEVPSKPIPLAPAVPLSHEEADSLLKGLPPLESDTLNEKDFSIGNSTLPPPIAGAAVSKSFPFPERGGSQPASSPPPLEVLRFSPEGDVGLPANLSVTFSQPMSSFNSPSDSVARNVPVKITPRIAGKWRWAGAQTLVFEPAARFPMATEFKAEVPAGTRSALGGTLPAAKKWRFKTPALQLIQTFPIGDSQPLDPVMVIEFNQKIDRSAVMKKVRVFAGQKVLKVRLASDQEIKSDSAANSMVETLEKGRWVAFRMADRKKVLPADTLITVSVDQDAPSAEGPIRTNNHQGYSFKTHGSFRVTGQNCRERNECVPSSVFEISLSNYIDVEKFTMDQVRVEPEIPGMKVECLRQKIRITGVKHPYRDYKVTLKPWLRDKFKQNLESETHLTFPVGASPPRLFSPDFGLVVLDPYARPHFSVYSLNHTSVKVRVNSVGPEHWADYAKNGRNARYSNGELGDLPGIPVISNTITIEDQPEKLVETRIDLTPALRDGFGNFLVAVEPIPAPADRHEKALTWVEVTGIGLDAFTAGGEILARATSLKDGKPISGVEIAFQDGSFKTSTTADGLAWLPGKTLDDSTTWVLAGRKDSDTAILPQWPYWWGPKLQSSRERRASGGHYDSGRISCSDGGQQREKLHWFVFDDRGVYRPGEEIHLKGWLRAVGCGPDGDVDTIAGRIKTVTYILKDENDTKILSGACEVNDSGGFDAILELPKEINLGEATLTFNAESPEYSKDSCTHTHVFSVEDFSRSEFVISTSVSNGTSFAGENATVTAAASHFAGDILANAKMRWYVSSVPSSFTPPNRSDFNFGRHTPSWQRNPKYVRVDSQSLDSKTDSAGRHTIQLDFIPVDPPVPTSVFAHVKLDDVNRQEWSSASTILVHPADLYVGLKSARLYAQKDKPLTIRIIVTGLDGKAVPGREVWLSAVQLNGAYEGGKLVEKETDRKEQAVVSGSDPVECIFEPKGGQRYRVTATVKDDRHRINQSELVFWVAGSDSTPERDLKRETLTIIPDMRNYHPGETAELLVQSPIYPAEGLLTIRRDGLVSTEPIQINGPSSIIKIPIKDSYTPNLFAQLDLTGEKVRANDSGELDERLPKRPAYASGNCELSVPPGSRELMVRATPHETILGPGGTAKIDIEIRDSEGKPLAGSEAALFGVDETVLGMVEYKIEDPLQTFYPERQPGVSAYYLRDNVLLTDPKMLANREKDTTNSATLSFMDKYSALQMEALLDREELMFKSMSAGDELEEKGVRLRTDSNPLAFFVPSVVSDSEGRAQVEVKLPNNLTRYRITAVAVAGGKQFGMRESAITVRRPLVVGPCAPRFLNFGDKFELPAIVQNLTDSPMDVNVAVRASNAELTSYHGLHVTVPANDRVEIRFPATSLRAGTARLQFAAKSGKFSDSTEISLPVLNPATTESFASYGQVDEGIVLQPVYLPFDAFKKFGSLEIDTSSTQLQTLSDALLYLASYPFKSAEHLSSKIIAVATLRNVLSDFKTEGLPSSKELIAAVELDLKRLIGLQNMDGGFSLWYPDDRSEPYLSTHVVHALQRAKNAGFDVPDEIMKAPAKYLEDVERYIPSSYGARARDAVIAYSLYVRNLMGSKDTEKARELIKKSGIEGLSIESIGWLLSVLIGDADSGRELESIRNHIRNQFAAGAAKAHNDTPYGNSCSLLRHSDRRADAVILEALIKDQPESDLIPGIFHRLLEHRKQGRWLNTQENAFALIALERYFSTFQGLPPDFQVQTWVGDRFAGAQEFKGYSTERHQLSVPMQFLTDTPAPVNLLLNKEGTGRLYYRLGLKYAYSNLKLGPADYGFEVERTYEAVDKPDDVWREADGSWRVKLGAKVRVRLKMAVPSMRHNVALVDHLPAGFEPLNPALSKNPVLQPERSAAEKGYSGTESWFDHQNFRDERVEAFTSLLWAGVYNYSYVARAATPGEFIAPPANAEEMYRPEKFGRGASDRLVIK